MRANEFLIETLSRIVYHYTGLHAAAKILSSGEFQLSSNLGSVEQQYSLKGYPYFLSTTRTKMGGYHNVVGASGVLFELDGNYYNQKYPSRSIDYWENRAPDKAYGRKHEAEDRLFSKDPSIPISGVKAVHVLVKPDADPEVKARGRTVLIAAKKRGIPTVFYDNEDAWRMLDTRKTADVSTLKGPQAHRLFYRSHRGYLLPWMEVLQAKSKNQLSKRAKEIVYRLSYSNEYYRRDMIAGLETEMSNARKPESGNDRENAVRIIKYMKANKLDTIADLIDNLAKKWSEDRESLNENKITIKSLYSDGYPQSDELFWNFIAQTDLDRPLTLQTMQPHIIESILLHQYNGEELNDLVGMLKPEQIETVNHYLDWDDLSNSVIVVADGKIVDGSHRALAAAMRRIPIQYLDLDEEPEEELDEGWKKHLATAAVAGGLALGGHYAMKDPAPNAEVSIQDMKPKHILPTPKPIEPKVFRQVGDSLKRPLAQVLIKEAQAAGLGGAELAQFLAQCAHETHDFRDLKEWGGRKDHKRYDMKYNPGVARILGNTKPGDGFKYIGRGFIQLTGKYNYSKAQEALDIPLLSKPELLEKPDIAAKVAVWFWKHRVAPKVDDFSDTQQATKPINSRLAGVDNRDSRFKAIAELFGIEI